MQLNILQESINLKNSKKVLEKLEKHHEKLTQSINDFNQILHSKTWTDDRMALAADHAVNNRAFDDDSYEKLYKAGKQETKAKTLIFEDSPGHFSLPFNLNTLMMASTFAVRTQLVDGRKNNKKSKIFKKYTEKT